MPAAISSRSGSATHSCRWFSKGGMCCRRRLCRSRYGHASASFTCLLASFGALSTAPLRCATWLSRSCHAKQVCLQAAWVTLLWHASIPRPILLAQLHETGRLQALLNSYSIAAATDPMLQLARDVSCKPVPISDAGLADSMHALHRQGAALSRRHEKPLLDIRKTSAAHGSVTVMLL